MTPVFDGTHNAPLEGIKSEPKGIHMQGFLTAQGRTKPPIMMLTEELARQVSGRGADITDSASSA